MKRENVAKVLGGGLCALFTAFALVGCARENDAEKSGNQNQSITIVDMAGDEVTIDEKADEIACTWPSGTQLFITLGMSDILVAVPDDSKEQPWAMHMAPNVKDLPLCKNELSVEELIKLEADVLITTEAEVARELRKKGICAITVNYYSVDEMKRAIGLIAEIVPTEYEEKCTAYLEYLNEQIRKVETALAGKVNEKKTLYYIHGGNDKGLYKTAGGNTMNEAWANYAYTEFVTSDLLDSSQTNVDAEAVLAKNPEYVVIGGRYQHRLYEQLFATPEWEEIDAIKNKRVIKAPMGVSPFDRFGAEFAMMIPWLAGQVYPEHYTFDAVNEIKEFYATFSGYEMTEDEANYVINGLMPDGSREIE